MKIEISPLIVDINGPFAGFGCYKLKGQRVIRTLPSNIPSPSPAQQAVRDQYVSLWNRYKTLPSIAADSWENPINKKDLISWARFMELNFVSWRDDINYQPCLQSSADIPEPVIVTCNWEGGDYFGISWDGSPYSYRHKLAYNCIRKTGSLVNYKYEGSGIAAQGGYYSTRLNDGHSWHIWIYVYNDLTLLCSSPAYYYLEKL